MCLLCYWPCLGARLLDRYPHALYHALYMCVAAEYMCVAADAALSVPFGNRCNVSAARANTCDMGARGTSEHAHQPNAQHQSSCLVSVNRSSIGIFLWHVVEVLSGYVNHVVNVIILLSSILLPTGAAS